MTEEERLLDRARDSLRAARIMVKDRYLITSPNARQVGGYRLEKTLQSKKQSK